MNIYFTPTERRIGEMLVTGMHNTEIAAALQIEYSTMKAHMNAMLRKTGTKDRLTLGLFLYHNREWLRMGIRIVRAA